MSLPRDSLFTFLTNTTQHYIWNYLFTYFFLCTDCELYVFPASVPSTTSDIQEAHSVRPPQTHHVSVPPTKLQNAPHQLPFPVSLLGGSTVDVCSPEFLCPSLLLSIPPPHPADFSLASVFSLLPQSNKSLKARAGME